jgi:hypothetical protein
LNWALSHSPNRAFQRYISPSYSPSKIMPSRRKNRSKRTTNVVGLGRQPPEINSTLVHTHVIRFSLAANAVATPITGGGILAAAGGICTVANTTVVPFHTCAKIHKVEIFNNQGAAESHAFIDWAGGGQFNVDDEKIRSIVGSANSNYLISRPPRMSDAGRGFNNSAAGVTFFFVTAPAAAIVDLTVTLWSANNIASISRGVAAGILGNIYYLALDSLTGAGTHNFVPEGLPTTA